MQVGFRCSTLLKGTDDRTLAALLSPADHDRDRCAITGSRAGGGAGWRRARLGLGHAVCWHSAIDRARAVAVSENLAHALWQDRRWLGAADLIADHPGLWLADRAGGGHSRAARRVSQLHRAAICAVHGVRRHSRHRHHARHAAAQHHAAGARHRVCQLDRHHWRRDGADPAADPRQYRAPAQCPRHRVLHHPGRQCRRCAVAAWRSAAVRRLPARRRFLLAAAAALAADPDRGWHPADGVLSARPLVRPSRAAFQHTAGAGRISRRHQFCSDRGDHRHDPAVGGMAAGHRVRCLWHQGRAAESGARRRVGADRAVVAVADRR